MPQLNDYGGDCILEVPPPGVVVSMSQMKEEICLQLQQEIQMGFATLTEKIVREIQTLSSADSDKGSESPTNDRNEPNLILEESPTNVRNEPNFILEASPAPPRNSKFNPLMTRSPSEDSLQVSSKSHRMLPVRDRVEIDIEKQSRSVKAYIISVITQIRNATLKDQDFPDNCLVRFVLGKLFTILCFLLIALNAIWMAYDGDAQVGRQISSQVTWRERVNLGFTLWFTLELVLRIAALQKYFIFGNDWVWNLFDLLLVLSSLPEIFMHSVNLTYIRLIRLAKLSRALRLIRLVKFFTSLREIIISLFYTLGCLFWSFVALILTTYIFALLFMQWFYLMQSDGVQYNAVVTEKFKSTWDSMLALFGMISGGHDWYEILQDLDYQADYASKNALVLYIFFTSFGLLNVIIAVFVGRAAESRDADEQLRVAKEEEHTSKTTSSLIQIFNEIDTERQGNITYNQFHAYFNKPKAQLILQSHGLQFFELQTMWEIMDEYDGSLDDSVDLPGFVMSMMRLSGNAKSTDLIMMARRVEKVQTRMRSNQREINHKIDKLLSAFNQAKDSQLEDDKDRWSL